MAKGINISIGSDAKAFLAGVKSGVIAPLEDAADTLDDLGKSGSKAGDQIENGLEGAERSLDDLGRKGKDAGNDLERGMQNAQEETDQFKKKFRAMADTVKQEARDAGRDIDTNFRRGTDGASEGLKDFKQESASTAKESAASFDGSAESIVDAFQEVAANAFIGFGPAGLVAGLAAAAGIGLISAAINQGGEDAERLKERVSELTSELIDAGRQGGPSLDYMVDKLKELAAETEDGADSLSTLAKMAGKAGLEFDKIAQAYVGNSKALKDLIKDNEDYVDLLEEQAQAASEAGDNEKYANLLKQAQGVERLNDTLRTNLDVTLKAEEAERHWLKSGGPEMEAKAAQIETINEAYDEAASEVDNFIDKESGLFDVGAYLASMAAREQAIQDYQQTLATSPLTAEAKSFLDSQGVEAAATFLQGYKAATPAQQAELNRIWTESGKQNSGVYGSTVKTALATAFNGVQIGGPTVQARVNVDRRELDAVMNRSYNVVINAVTQLGKKWN